MRSLFRAELQKYCVEIRTYYPDHIVDLVTKFILFATFFYGFVRGAGDSATYSIGYMYWIIASGIVSELSVGISFEKQVGTIEQLTIKPYPFWLILTIKTYVVLVVTTLKCLLLLALIRVTLPIRFNFNVSLLWILLVSVVGFTGIGLALSGLTMKFAKTASFESIISYALLFFSGAIIYFTNMPTVVQKILDVVPFTAGIKASQQALTPAAPHLLPVLLWLLFINALWFATGYWIFSAMFRNVKRNGVLNNY